MQLKSQGLIKENQLIKQIEKQFKFFKRIEDLGTNSILEDPSQSTFWIVDSTGTKIRPICGNRKSDGTICFQQAGWGTEHLGFGRCQTHKRSPLYNLALSESENYPTRLRGFLELSDEVDNNILNKLDPEIKILSALLNYILTLPEDSERTELSLEEIETAKGLLKEIIKAKTLRQKMLREIQLDYKHVKEFVGQIFSVIVHDLDPVQARNLMSDIYNKVIVPFQKTSQLSTSDYSLKQKISEVVSKVGNDDF